MLKLLTEKNLNVIGLFILILGIEFFIFGDLLIHPNSYLLAGSGDGMQIYFNNLFHIKNGSGVILSNQLYPSFEVIFMTDAQSSFTLILQFIHQHIFPIADYSIGILNSIILYSIPICGIFLYLIFKELNIKNWIAFTFAILICFLSPQLVRITAGHFGLAYPFYIPMIFYFLIKLSTSNSIKYFIFIILVILFFGFNNAHMMLTGALIALSFGLISFLKQKSTKLSYRILPFLSGLIPLVLILILFKSLEIYHDREKISWGFLIFHSSIEAIIFPTQGKVLEFWTNYIFKKIEPHNAEGEAYIGLSTLFLCILLIIKYLKQIIRQRKLPALFLNQQVNFMLATGALIFIYSMAIPFRWLDNYELLGKIPYLNQFRCPGRFAWVFFYSLSIGATYYFHLLIQKYKIQKKRVIPIALSLVLIGAFAFDDCEFKAKYFKGIEHISSNFFSKENHEFDDMINSNQINKSNYQAILGFPVFNSWNAKFVQEEPSWTTRTCNIISVKTNLPQLNAKLSRISTGSLFNSVQLYSNPLIRKTLLEKMNSKRILFITEHSIPLTQADSFLIKKSILLFKDEHICYFSFDPSSDLSSPRKLANSQFDSVEKKLQNGIYSESKLPIITRLSDKLQKGNYKSQTTILDTNITLIGSENYEISLWQIIDSKTFGNSHVEFIAYNKNNTELIHEYKWFSNSTDYQLNAVRMAFTTKLDSSITRIKLVMDNNENAITRICIKPKDALLFQQIGKLRYFNNYCINE